MERRALLTRLGIGTAAAIGGCLTRADTSADSGNDSDPDDSGPTDGRIPAGERHRRTVGDGSLGGDALRRPHAVALANRTAEPVDATFAIRTADGPVLEEDLELGPDASIVVSLTELARYVVEATVPDAGVATTQTLDLESFDCNGGQTTFALQPDGRLESRTVSTTMACLDVVTERVGPGESIERTIAGGPPGETDASDDERHSLAVENPTTQPWTVRVVLSESGDPRFDGVFALGAEASVNLPIAELGEYELHASVLETGASERASVGTGFFDCNVSTTNATVTDDGGLRIRTISTMIACDADATVDDETDGAG